MFDEKAKAIASHQAAQLSQGQTEIPFKDLISQTLPDYLWDHFSVILNPQAGGQVSIGTVNLDLDDPEANTRIVNQLNNECVLTSQELADLLQSAIENRLQFILDPAETLTRMVFERSEDEKITSGKIKATLDGLARLLERWDSNVARATNQIKSYLSSLTARPVSRAEFSRILSSSIDKELAHDPLPGIEVSLQNLNQLIQPEPGHPVEAAGDYVESTSQILANRGLASWTPALLVERELAGAPLDVEGAIRTLRRFRIFQEGGLLGAEAEEMVQVEEELESFTSFLKRGLE